MTPEQKDFFIKSIQALRDKDRKASRHIRNTKYKTPWEIDSLRLRLRDREEFMPFTMNGRNVAILPNRKVRPPAGMVGIYIEDLLVYQFMEPSAFEKVMQVYMAFGVCALTGYPNKELDELIAYCEKMDEAIVDLAFQLREKKIVNIFHAVWVEMGGDSIREDDRLGQRIGYYKEILSRFKKNNNEYQKELDDLKLMG